MELINLNYRDIISHWELNPRTRSQDFIDDLYINMKEDGYNRDYPLKVFRFPNQKGYHLSDGHHRYEAAAAAGITEIPCEVIEGTPEQHLESICLDNMRFDVRLGNVGQMYSSKEKRQAIQSLLLIPEWWRKSDRWIADDFRVSNQSISNYRESFGVKILTPDEINISTEQFVALQNEILKRQRVGKDGVTQSVKCSVADTLEQYIESQGKQVVLKMYDYCVDAANRSIAPYKNMPDMSADEITKFREHILRVIHPDKLRSIEGLGYDNLPEKMRVAYEVWLEVRKNELDYLKTELTRDGKQAVKQGE